MCKCKIKQVYGQVVVCVSGDERGRERRKRNRKSERTAAEEREHERGEEEKKRYNTENIKAGEKIAENLQSKR